MLGKAVNHKPSHTARPTNQGLSETRAVATASCEEPHGQERHIERVDWRPKGGLQDRRAQHTSYGVEFGLDVVVGHLLHARHVPDGLQEADEHAQLEQTLRDNTAHKACSIPPRRKRELTSTMQCR